VTSVFVTEKPPMNTGGDWMMGVALLRDETTISSSYVDPLTLSIVTSSQMTSLDKQVFDAC
jgi:hypothetical protein